MIALLTRVSNTNATACHLNAASPNCKKRTKAAKITNQGCIFEKICPIPARSIFHRRKISNPAETASLNQNNLLIGTDLSTFDQSFCFSYYLECDLPPVTSPPVKIVISIKDIVFPDRLV